MNYLDDKDFVYEIQNKYSESIIRLGNILLTTVNASSLLEKEDAKNYLLYGVGRRVSYIKETLERLFDIAKREINKEVLDDHNRFDQTVLLNFFFSNISGVIDNLAWVFAKECEFDFKSHFEVSFKNKKFLATLPQIFTESLRVHEKWLHVHVKDFRDASAHRILPYVLPYVETKDSKDKIFTSYYTHDFKTAPMVPFHPQVLSDVLGVIEILEVGVKSLKGLEA